MLQQATDPGSGEKYSSQTKRIINKDGSFNVVRKGGTFNSRDFYLFLINTSWSKFLGLILLFYLIVNLFFTSIYLLTGLENLANLPPDHKYLGVYFFSVQTFTTVGYGNISPQGISANIIASFEAMSGWLFFALATGLLYGRFSRPSARILFSRNMIVTPAEPWPKLMFRIVNQRSNMLMEMEGRMILVLTDRTNNQHNRKYYNLKLEIPNIVFFPMNWTMVHVINEESPMFGKTPEDLRRQEAEILIHIKGFDDSFSQVLHTRYSYRHEELVWNARFRRAYETDEYGNIIMHLDEIHSHDTVPESELVSPV
ncbi:MAG: ion channel [Bacteroidota bacterium]|nr:ion channel [Bacteroidota bacterium]